MRIVTGVTVSFTESTLYPWIRPPPPALYLALFWQAKNGQDSGELFYLINSFLFEVGTVYAEFVVSDQRIKLDV